MSDTRMKWDIHVKCERCSEMKLTRDNPADAVCGRDDVCMKLLCKNCWNATHKKACYLCGAKNCCFLYFGNGIKRPCCSECR